MPDQYEFSFNPPIIPHHRVVVTRNAKNFIIRSTKFRYRDRSIEPNSYVCRASNFGTAPNVNSADSSPVNTRSSPPLTLPCVDSPRKCASNDPPRRLSAHLAVVTRNCLTNVTFRTESSYANFAARKRFCRY